MLRSAEAVDVGVAGVAVGVDRDMHEPEALVLLNGEPVDIMGVDRDAREPFVG